MVNLTKRKEAFLRDSPEQSCSCTVHHALPHFLLSFTWFLIQSFHSSWNIEFATTPKLLRDLFYFFESLYSSSTDLLYCHLLLKTPVNAFPPISPVPNHGIFSQLKSQRILLKDHKTLAPFSTISAFIKVYWWSVGAGKYIPANKRLCRRLSQFVCVSSYWWDQSSGSGAQMAATTSEISHLLSLTFKSTTTFYTA